MGSRQHVSWGAMAAGPARTLGDWLQFCQLPEAVQQERLVGMRGSTVMISGILKAILEQWTQQGTLVAPTWMGAFTRTEVLIAIRGCSGDTTLFFEVETVGKLQWVQREAELVSACTF